ncbi:MAG: hypothetical protein KBB83_08320 [Alphaproteobacteria bacterium]|nr:hypothetical protein [Alphaproteobacteria bacterium]
MYRLKIFTLLFTVFAHADVCVHASSVEDSETSLSRASSYEEIAIESPAPAPTNTTPQDNAHPDTDLYIVGGGICVSALAGAIIYSVWFY